MNRATLVAMAATLASVGIDMGEAVERRKHSTRSGVNTSREQARRMRQTDRARTKAARAAGCVACEVEVIMHDTYDRGHTCELRSTPTGSNANETKGTE